jgi:hypothetical protein
MLAILASVSRTVAPTLPEMNAALTQLAALAAQDMVTDDWPDELAHALLKRAKSMPQFLGMLEAAGRREARFSRGGKSWSTLKITAKLW